MSTPMPERYKGPDVDEWYTQLQAIAERQRAEAMMEFFAKMQSGEYADTMSIVMQCNTNRLSTNLIGTMPI